MLPADTSRISYYLCRIPPELCRVPTSFWGRCKSTEVPICSQGRIGLFFGWKMWQRRLGAQLIFCRATHSHQVLPWNFALFKAGLRKFVAAHHSWSPKELLVSIAARIKADQCFIPPDPYRVPTSSWGRCKSTEAPICSQRRSRLFFWRKIQQHHLGVEPRWRRAYDKP